MADCFCEIDEGERGVYVYGDDYDALAARLAKQGDWCDICNAPQYVLPDGSHSCDHAPVTQARIVIFAADNARLTARLAETLSEQDFEYNRKTNDLIERHAKQIEGLLARLAEAEAKIDALMLEFCPAEMTQEQVDRWMAHQVAADSATGQESESHE